MSKVLILKGLPGSGKSTRARELVKEGWTRVNRDDLRAMLHSSHWSTDNEKLVVKMRDLTIMETLKRGKNVVVDDTNLSAKVEKDIRKIAALFNAEVGVQFFDTPLNECIHRDALRTGTAHVGEKVIVGMYRKYLANRKNFQVENPLTLEEYAQDKIEWIEGLPTAIICDLDGTLALMCDRSPYDYKACINDTLCRAVDNVVRRFGHDHNFDLEPVDIILMSGRDSMCREETETWLKNNEVEYQHLYMRPEGDSRKDAVVKRELFDAHIRGKYNVLFVLDDRDQVVELWRSMGLQCFQVAEGAF